MFKLIFGCGPGRCGTTSLSALLDKQEGCTCTHSCPVKGGPQVKLLDLMDRDSEFAADVAPWWLWKAKDIYSIIKDIKFIILWRPIDDIIRSMYNSGYINAVPFGRLKKNPEEWVRDYYLDSCRLAANLPDIVRFHRTEHLSKIDVQEGLLRWCGFSNPITIENLHLNKSTPISA